MSNVIDPTSPSGEATSGVSRRRLVATAAWSVPAVSLAVATPAYAASGVDEQAVTMSLVERHWGTTLAVDDMYVYVTADVTNLSTNATVENLFVTITLGGTWRNGSTVDIDPGEGGVTPSWGTNWADTGATNQGPIGGPATRQVRLSALPPGATSRLKFRARRAVLLAISRPSDHPVGLAITSVPTGWTVAAGSLTTFNTPA